MTVLLTLARYQSLTLVKPHGLTLKEALTLYDGMSYMSPG